jgi:RNA polymerase sigma-70 factor (sigma-E family)
MPAIPGAGDSVGSGDREQFHQFMVSRWPKLVRLAYGLTGDRWAAEDLAQVALVNAYAAWWRVRRADDPDAYVRKILITAFNRRFRRRQAVSGTSVRQEPGDLPRDGPAAATGDPAATTGDPAATTGVPASRERPALLAALVELPPRQRAVIVLRYWEDMTDAQVAAMLGRPESTVRSQAGRALAKLRPSIELADGEPGGGELADGEPRKEGHAWEGGPR